jgi:hypothetical protein
VEWSCLSANSRHVYSKKRRHTIGLAPPLGPHSWIPWKAKLILSCSPHGSSCGGIAALFFKITQDTAAAEILRHTCGLRFKANPEPTPKSAVLGPIAVQPKAANGTLPAYMEFRKHPSCPRDCRPPSRFFLPLPHCLLTKIYLKV